MVLRSRIATISLRVRSCAVKCGARECLCHDPHKPSHGLRAAALHAQFAACMLLFGADCYRSVLSELNGPFPLQVAEWTISVPCLPLENRGSRAGLALACVQSTSVLCFLFCSHQLQLLHTRHHLHSTAPLSYHHARPPKPLYQQLVHQGERTRPLAVFGRACTGDGGTCGTKLSGRPLRRALRDGMRVLMSLRRTTQTFSTSSTARLAKLNLIGRLGATPTVAKDKAGKDILIYSVATTDRITGGSAGSDGGVCSSWLRLGELAERARARRRNGEH